MKTLVLTISLVTPVLLPPLHLHVLTTLAGRPHHNLVIAFLLPFLHLEGVNVNGLLASPIFILSISLVIVVLLPPLHLQEVKSYSALQSYFEDMD